MHSPRMNPSLRTGAVDLAVAMMAPQKLPGGRCGPRDEACCGGDGQRARRELRACSKGHGPCSNGHEPCRTQTAAADLVVLRVEEGGTDAIQLAVEEDRDDFRGW